MLVKRFGETLESPPLQQWYELETGERVPCSEFKINKLWVEWASSTGAKRERVKEFIIFEFNPAIDIDL